MKKHSFLGTGWRFKLTGTMGLGVGLGELDGRLGDRIAEVSEEEAVRQSIWLILGTAPGERVARPDFGCQIHDLVFGLPGAKLSGDAAQAVRSALEQWEPRIDVLRVEVHPAPGQEGLLLVDVHYAIRATNSRFNLVYPFHLS